jgi:hypothetical protein
MVFFLKDYWYDFIITMLDQVMQPYMHVGYVVPLEKLSYWKPIFKGTGDELCFGLYP